MKELIYHRHLLPATEQHADKVAVIDGTYCATYAQHLDRVARTAGALATLGVRRDERVAVMALNSHRFLELYHAAFLGAGVVNPLNLRLAPNELAFILADSGTKVCFTDAFFAKVIEQVREEVGLEHVVLLGNGDAPHDADYEELLAAATPVIPDEPEEEDPVILMYTGGTTGTPKGVLLDQRAELLNLYHVSMAWRIASDEVYLHQTPMFHAASLGGIVGVPAQGGTSVIVPLFDPVGVMDAIELNHVTMTVMVPTMIAMLLNHDAFRPERIASLRTLTYGASPMPAALLDRVLATFPTLDVLQGYGMTESSAVLTVLGADEHRSGGARLQSAGRPLQGVVLSIQDAAGNAVPTGVTGEVCARGGNFMREYWKQAKATEEAFRGGWYHTGDAGYLDERRLSLPRRPSEGHDRHRRRERLLGGSREHDRQLSRRRAGRGDRRPRRDVGRGRPRDRGASSRNASDRGTDHRPHAQIDRGLQGAEVGRDPYGPAAAVRRAQGSQEGSPRTVLGRPRAAVN